MDVDKEGDWVEKANDLYRTINEIEDLIYRDIVASEIQRAYWRLKIAQSELEQAISLPGAIT